MNNYLRRETFGLTLVELLIAIVIFSTVMLSIASISYFSQHHVLSAARRARLQNELSYALAHMAKNVQRAVGHSSSARPALESIPNSGFKVWVEPSTPTPSSYSDDVSIDYTLSVNTLSCSLGGETLSTHIVSGVAYGIMPTTNPDKGFYIDLTGGGSVIEIGLAARQKPAEASGVDNPEVTMKTRLYARSASTH